MRWCAAVGMVLCLWISAVSGGEDPVSVAGWEGFFGPEQVTGEWLKRRHPELAPDVAHSPRPRVVKLILPGPEIEQPEAEVLQRHTRYCGQPEVRGWNETLCASLEARSCSDGICRFQDFGNCSGFLWGDGAVLTAAHCVATLASDEGLRRIAQVLRQGRNGRPEALPMESIILGKRDFAHHGVAVEESDPVDAALVTVAVSGVASWPLAPLPAKGAFLFAWGFPRVDSRSLSSLRSSGYGLVPGTPALTIGRMAEPNAAELPLCNVDGRQQNWALRSPCPVGPVELDGGRSTWRGPILMSPFLHSADMMSGLSGAPVFDTDGRLVGLNATVLAEVDPRQRYSPTTRGVATPIRVVLRALGLERNETTAPGEHPATTKP